MLLDLNISYYVNIRNWIGQQAFLILIHDLLSKASGQKENFNFIDYNDKQNYKT